MKEYYMAYSEGEEALDIFLMKKVRMGFFFELKEYGAGWFITIYLP